MKTKLIIMCLAFFCIVFLSNGVSFAEQSDTFRVKVVVEPEEGGTASGAGVYRTGQDVVLEAAANEGYVFSGWYREDGTTFVSPDVKLVYSLETPRTYIARFEKALSLSVAAEPLEGGTVEQNGNGSYVFGDSVTLTATANEGYSFLGWFNVASPANPISDSPTYTFSIQQPFSLVAKFSTQNKLQVAVEPPGGGSVKGDGEYASGSIVMLEAIPETDYRFVGWYYASDPDHAISQEDKYTFNLDADAAIMAKFTWSYQYIGIRVLGIGAIVAGGIIGIIIWVKHAQMIQRSNTNLKSAQYTTIHHKKGDTKLHGRRKK